MVAVELGEILRDLALAERIVKRVVDQLRLDAVARGGVAVDLQLQRRALALLVGRDVAQLGQRLHLGQDLRRPFVEFVQIGILQRELELGSRRPAAQPHVLRRLHVEPRALDLFELGTQPGDDLLGARAALVARLQRDEQVAVVAGPAAAADRHGHAGDVGVGLHDLAQGLLLLHHGGEGNVLRGFGRRGDQAVVLLREEALGNDDEQIDRQRQRREEDQRASSTRQRSARSRPRS